MTGEIKTNTIEIQKNYNGNYEKLYSNILDNLEEMAKFLETCTTITETRRNRKREQTNTQKRS